MKPINLPVFLITLLFSFAALADMSWEEVQRDGKAEVTRKFYLKANLMRVDLDKPGLSYFYNLDNHSLAVLNRDKDSFYFLDWKSLSEKALQMSASKKKLLGEAGAGKGHPGLQDPAYFYYDPFGVEPLFYCPGSGFEAKALGKTRKISGMAAKEFSIACAGRVVAQAWVNAGPEQGGDWQRYLDGLMWVDAGRYQFYFVLSSMPVLIQSQDAAAAGYEIRDFSREAIPLDKFILPENAKPVAVPQTRD